MMSALLVRAKQRLNKAMTAVANDVAGAVEIFEFLRVNDQEAWAHLEKRARYAEVEMELARNAGLKAMMKVDRASGHINQLKKQHAIEVNDLKASNAATESLLQRSTEELHKLRMDFEKMRAANQQEIRRLQHRHLNAMQSIWAGIFGDEREPPYEGKIVEAGTDGTLARAAERLRVEGRPEDRKLRDEFLEALNPFAPWLQQHMRTAERGTLPSTKKNDAVFLTIGKMNNDNFQVIRASDFQRLIHLIAKVAKK